MKLMPPANVSDRKAQEQARDVLRTQELNDASDKARKKLADSESDFKATLARQRLQWAQGEEEHAKRTQEMDIEITALEKRKEQALIPIELYKQEANEIYKQAETALALVKEKESRADELSERLQDRLDTLGERESNLDTRERKAVVERSGLESQREQVDANSISLREAMASFNTEKQKQEKEIAQKAEENTLKERSLLAKEESLYRKEKALEEESIRLKDQRGTLERAFARLSPLSQEK